MVYLGILSSSNNNTVGTVTFWKNEEYDENLKIDIKANDFII